MSVWIGIWIAMFVTIFGGTYFGYRLNKKRKEAEKKEIIQYDSKLYDLFFQPFLHLYRRIKFYFYTRVGTLQSYIIV